MSRGQILRLACVFQTATMACSARSGLGTDDGSGGTGGGSITQSSASNTSSTNSSATNASATNTTSGVLICDLLCEVSQPANVCGIQVDIGPYAFGGPFGGFQSTPGTGVQSTITVTFSSPVSGVGVTALDPDFETNEMIARDVQGAVLERVGFEADNTPGTYSESEVFIDAAGIASVELVPANADYVAYDKLVFCR
jgi:hypothetical protein